MCFSATASFLVAATTGMIGVAAIRHVKDGRNLPLAVVPLLFAAQQTVEGVLWMQLNGTVGREGIGTLSLIFLVFAEVIWPAFAAIAVLSIEPEKHRRHILRAIVIVGCLLSAYLLFALLGEVRIAAIRGHSISYGGESNPISWRQVPYLICVCAPLLLSSHRTIKLFGLLILFGFWISAYVFVSAFISVWCFFAAAGSVLLYFHFRQAARKTVALSPSAQEF